MAVEVTVLENGIITFTDSHGAVVHFTPGEFHAFVTGAKAGEFDDLL